MSYMRVSKTLIAINKTVSRIQSAYSHNMTERKNRSHTYLPFVTTWLWPMILFLLPSKEQLKSLELNIFAKPAHIVWLKWIIEITMVKLIKVNKLPFLEVCTSPTPWLTFSCTFSYIKQQKFQYFLQAKTNKRLMDVNVC